MKQFILISKSQWNFKSDEDWICETLQDYPDYYLFQVINYWAVGDVRFDLLLKLNEMYDPKSK